MTGRDHVWDEAIDLIAEQGMFKASQLKVDVGRSTRQDVLRTMEDLEWLARDPPESTIWRAGPKAIKRLNMSPEAIKNAYSGT